MKKLFLLFIVFLTVSMAIFPSQTYAGAQQGLALWWEVVLPSLLPFFICAELLVALGAIHYLGILLEPLMRPVFRLPGGAALAIVMGYTSGFPTGAAITAILHKNGIINGEEGSRLIAFTNNSSPLFIIVGVATGILQTPQAAWILLAIHYLSNLSIGILLGQISYFKNRLHKKGSGLGSYDMPANNWPIGIMIKNAAQKAGTNIAIIGCYIIFFSVLIQVCGQVLLVSGISPLFFQLISAFNIHPDLASAFANGFWEMTLGINAIGDSVLPIGIKLPICAAILAWGGISVWAQVAAMVSGTDIRLKTYFVCRIIHSTVSFFVALLLCRNMQIFQTTMTTTPGLPPIPLQVSFLFSCTAILALLLLTITAKHRQTRL